MKRFFKTFISVLLVEALLFASLCGNAVSVLADDFAENQELIKVVSEIEDGEQVSEKGILLANLVEPKPTPGNLSSAKIAGAVQDYNGKPEIPFIYQDSYFNGPSTEYNHSLSTMSLILAMSAFNARDSKGKIWYDEGYHNLKALLTDIGYVDFQANECYTQFSGEDTMGVGIATKYIELSDGTIQPIIAVAYRGGNYENEWAGNVKIGKSGEHQGFAEARNIGLNHLNLYLEIYQDKLGAENVRSPKLWLVGYSRSSAAATLSGSAIDCALLGEGPDEDMMNTLKKNLSKYKVKFEDVYVYGFEVPRGSVDGGAYQASNTKNIWCIVDTTDPVPQVAPDKMGFHHVGTDVQINDVYPERFMEQMNQIDPVMAQEWIHLKQRDGMVVSEWGIKSFWNWLVYRQTNDLPAIDHSAIGADYSEFVYNLVNDFLVNALISTSNNCGYVGREREFYAEHLQKPLSIIIRILMVSPEADKKTLKSVALSKWGEILKPWTLATLLTSLPASLVGGNETVLGSFFQDMISDVLLKCALDPEFTRILPVSEINAIRDEAYSLGRLASSILVKDYFNQLRYIAAFVNYGSELFEPHEPPYVLAYLRTADENYYSDRNSSSLYQVSVQAFDSENPKGKVPQDIRVRIYTRNIVGDTEEKLAAEINGTSLRVFDKDAWQAGGISLNDDKLTISMLGAGWVKYDSVVSFEIENMSADKTQNVKINYNFFSDGRQDKAVTQPFEEKAMDIAPDDKCVITPIGTSKNAYFKKIIKLTPKFVDEDMNPLPEGECSVKAGNSPRDLGSLNIDEKNEFTVQPPYGYYLKQMAFVELDENGNVKVDPELEKPYLHTVKMTPEWDYSTTSGDIYIICDERQHDGIVRAETVYQYLKLGYNKINEKAADNMKLTIQNRTKGTIAQGTGAQSLEADPGDIIYVTLSVNSINDSGKDFVTWDFDFGEPEWTFDYPNRVSFTMPEGGVSMKAVIGDHRESVKLTYTGTWAGNVAPPSTSSNWRQIYIDSPYSEIAYKNSSYNYPVKHILEKRTYQPGEASIKAPGYPADSSEDMVFDYWEVLQVDDNDWQRTFKCTDKLVPVASYNEETGLYENTYVAANGYTGETIKLVNIEHSLILIPHYKPAEYTLTYTLSDGSVHKEKLKAGDTIELKDQTAEGYEHDDWSGYYYPVEVTTSDYNDTIRTVSEKPVTMGEVHGDAVYTFTMPRGDAYLTATSTKQKFQVILGDDYLRISGEKEKYSFMETINVYPGLIPRDKVLTGLKAETAHGPIAVETLKDAEGMISGFRFKMPSEDVTLSAILEDEEVRTLTVVNGTAEYIDEDYAINETQEGIYKVYKDDIVDLKVGTIPTGKLFDHWSITAGNAKLIGDRGTDVYLVIQDDDVTVEAVLKDKQLIEEIKLEFTSSFANKQYMPTNAIVRGEGVEENHVSIDWHLDNPDIWRENPVIVGYPYNPTFELTPENGWYVDENTVVTLNGKRCALTETDTGKIHAECKELRTDSSIITDISRMSENIRIKAGAELATIVSELDTYAFVDIDNNKDFMMARINWDTDNLKAAPSADAAKYDYQASDTENSQIFYVKGNIVLQTGQEGDKVEYIDGYLNFGDGMSSEVWTKVVTIPLGTIASPYASDVKPGVYRDNQVVHLTTETPNAKIYYILDDGSSTEKYEVDDIISLGNLYDSESGIALNGVMGENCRCRILAVSVLEERFEEGEVIYEAGHSEVAELDYEINIVDSTLYKLTVINGSGEGKYLHDGESRIGIVANPPEAGTHFIGFTVDEGSVEFLPEYSTDKAKSFYMPKSDVVITAHYAVDRASLVIQSPVAGKEFDYTVMDTVDCPIVVAPVELHFLDENGNPIATGKIADYDTEYSAEIKLASNYNGAVGFSFDPNVKVKINGEEATVVSNDDGSITVRAKLIRTEPRKYALTLVNGKVYDAETDRELVKENEKYMIRQGQKIKIIADEKANHVFRNWTSDSDAINVSEKTAEFVMPASDAVLTANYDKLISKVNLTMDELVKGTELPQTVVCDNDGVEEGSLVIEWNSDGAYGMPVTEDVTYVSTIELKAKAGLIFADMLVVTINGVNSSVYRSGDGKTARVGELYMIEKEIIVDDGLGDVNGDNVIDSLDAVLLKQYLAGYSVDDLIRIKNADVNEDGIVNSIDAVMLMQKLAGYDVSFGK